MDIGIITNIERKLTPGKSSGRRDTFVATAYRPNIENQIPVYFKLFDKLDTDRGIFNEIVGFHVARLCGLPVSRDTFVSICDRTKIKGPARCLQGRDASETHIRGVASIDSNPHKIKQLFDDFSVYETELLNWKQLAQVAVYDELMLNTDRTAYNLVRTNKNEYVIIDYEHVFGGAGWNIELLEAQLTQPLNQNHLASLVTSGSNEFVSRRMMSVANEYISRIKLTKDILDFEYDLESFCHLDKGTMEHIFYLLNKRIKMLPELIHYHIQHGQLFYEES